MAHIGGRTFKNIEPPRPLKLQSTSMKTNFMHVEELIQLIENVGLTLQSGINHTEPMATLVHNLRIHGPQLESISKDTLDRAFVVFRNASQDERLNIMTRLNLLELIELRAKGWEDTGNNSYYKTKQATNIELPDNQYNNDSAHAAFLSTSPTFGGAGSAMTAIGFQQQQQQQQQLLLGPGEVIRNSGKFPKPTKIPGKTYCKDEVVIRNADSGKVMGIKGRRVHMIEELSETIISFQRVNPGAKERLVQITGPSEEKINYGKKLIEDTIRRNASPVRLDPATTGGGSCSSLTSSNSDEATPRTHAVGGSTVANRLSFNSAQNFMTASVAATQQVGTTNAMSHAPITPSTGAGKLLRQNQPSLLHSLSTNDASLEEYKYTVNVGHQLIKITGNCCELVRVAKLVLDDYFSSAEFLASIDAGAAFDGSATMMSPLSTPSTPMGQPQFIMGAPLQTSSPLADSGIGLNYMNTKAINNTQEVDDEVFCDGNSLSNSNSQNNGLARSRRSHFSRKDSTPEMLSNTTVVCNVDENQSIAKSNNDSRHSAYRYEYEHLLFYAKSPHSWALPINWQKICEKYPAIVRNKVKHKLPTKSILQEASDNASTYSTASAKTINNYDITVLTLNGYGNSNDDIDKNFKLNTTSTQTAKRNICLDRLVASSDNELPVQQQNVLELDIKVATFEINNKNTVKSIISRDASLSYNEWKTLRQEFTKTSIDSNKELRAPKGEKLLNKQFKLISDIIIKRTNLDEPCDMRKSSIKSFENDDDIVEFVSESKYPHHNNNNNYSSVKYRSNSASN